MSDGVTLGPACRRPSPSSGGPQGYSGWKNCCCCYDALRCVTGMVQVPAYHGGADRRPSNRHVTQGGDDSHTRQPSFGFSVLLDVVVVDGMM